MHKIHSEHKEQIHLRKFRTEKRAMKSTLMLDNEKPGVLGRKWEA